MLLKAMPEQTASYQQFATYAEAIRALPKDAEWSCSFGDYVVGLNVYFRNGRERWSISNNDPRFDAWVLVQLQNA